MGFRLRGMALCGATALMLAGCASAAPGENSGPSGAVEQPAQQEGDAHDGVTAEAIVAAIEPVGLECTDDQDPSGDDRAQVIQCKGDDYVIITATRLVDAGLVKTQTAAAKTAVCESGHNIDGTRFATSGAWVLAPGSSGDKNVAAFTEAMKTLGLEWSLDAC